MIGRGKQGAISSTRQRFREEDFTGMSTFMQQGLKQPSTPTPTDSRRHAEVALLNDEKMQNFLMAVRWPVKSLLHYQQSNRAFLLQAFKKPFTREKR